MSPGRSAAPDRAVSSSLHPALNHGGAGCRTHPLAWVSTSAPSCPAVARATGHLVLNCAPRGQPQDWTCLWEEALGLFIAVSLTPHRTAFPAGPGHCVSNCPQGHPAHLPLPPSSGTVTADHVVAAAVLLLLGSEQRRCHHGWSSGAHGHHGGAHRAPGTGLSGRQHPPLPRDSLPVLPSCAVPGECPRWLRHIWGPEGPPRLVVSADHTLC